MYFTMASLWKCWRCRWAEPLESTDLGVCVKQLFQKASLFSEKFPSGDFTWGLLNKAKPKLFNKPWPGQADPMECGVQNKKSGDVCMVQLQFSDTAPLLWFTCPSSSFAVGFGAGFARGFVLCGLHPIPYHPCRHLGIHCSSIHCQPIQNEKYCLVGITNPLYQGARLGEAWMETPVPSESEAGLQP